MARLKMFLTTAALFLLGMAAQATSARISTATVKVNGDVTLTLPSAYSSVLQYQATGVNYRWYSDNTSKATVSYSSYKTCTVRGKAEGTCRVYFYASFFIDGYYRTYDFYWDITVSGYTGGGGSTIVDPVSISIHPASLTLEVGQSYNLTYSVYPANATYYNPEWVSYREEIATVSNTGTVTAVGPGTAYIYLWLYKKDGGNLAETCEVNVVPKLATEQHLALEELPQFTDGDGVYELPSETIEGLPLTWTCGNGAVATVSGNMLTITGAGTTTLTATQAGNDSYLPFSRVFTLTVREVTPGDANNDGDITMEDATAIVNHILGKPTERFYSKAADVNHDGKVTIADVTVLIDNILATNQANHYLHVDVEELNYNKNGGLKEVTVDTDGSYTVTSSDPSWLTIYQDENSFRAIASENTTGKERETTIIVTMTGSTLSEQSEIVIPVKQSHFWSGVIEIEGGDKIFMIDGHGVGTSFWMKAIYGGTFQMGSSDSEADSNEQPTHQVTLSGYSIGTTEVTQELWEAVMGTNPSSFRGEKLPVENISWDDCQEFIEKLNVLTAHTGYQFRLPTEAEWEYAARGGKKSLGYKYSGSDDIDAVAWYNENCDSKTHAVGTKQANELGLYDMSGNVWEWCQDWYDNYGSDALTNPSGPSNGYYRVYRGGSWANYATCCRSSYRSNSTPSNHNGSLGFRLAL